MSIVQIQNTEQYNQLISSKKPTVALFSALWAEQCKQILDVLIDISSKYSDRLQIINIPAEELSEISLKHQIEAVPTVIFFKNNTAIDRIDGIDIVALNQKCISLAGESLENRLKNLINKEKVMVFIKGTKQIPVCGFSKQIVAILNETRVPYETFNILEDEEVRQGLKTYSDWPTYPQVYVKGELVGGLDIIKDLLTQGELVQTLKE